MNVPKLTEVSVMGPYDDSWSCVLSQLSCCLSQLESLMLETLESMKDMRSLQIAVDACKDHGLMKLTSLVNACPQLQKFKLQLSWIEKGTRCALKYLTVFEFGGYYGHTSDGALLTYLTEKAVALKKIIIDLRDQIPSRLPLEMDDVQQSAITCALWQLKQLVPQNVELVII